MSERTKGRLIIIGGHEGKEKQGKRAILKEVAASACGDKGRLVVITAATRSPEASAKEYLAVFHDLGVREVEALDIRAREDAHDADAVATIAHATAVFFTGGDQLRITSQIGDTPIFRCLHEIYRTGATIAGTSAGAAAMPETMLISGSGDESFSVSALGMAPGLGLISGVVIDSHFAERGRMGRLLGAVAQNPRNLGLGIDEDTAIVVEETSFGVLGTGAVYAVDGTTLSYSSLSEQHPEGTVSIFDVKLHVLAENDRFDLARRRPISSTEAAPTASNGEG